jgi:hypothetical protein
MSISNTSFKKGHESWCKGKTGLVGNYKPNSGSFEKGHNAKPIGAVKIKKDTSTKKLYLFIKTETGWKLAHKHLWELHKGPIPSGTVIRFKDGNSLNCFIENLELKAKVDVLQENSFNNWPPDLREIANLNAQLLKAIKEYEKL